MFIVIEGIDGAGKTTQAGLLARRLRRSYPATVLTQEPGGTALGEHLRELVKHGTDLDITPQAELLLFAASRAQLVERVLRPALDQGIPVISDRYIYSTVAYQGYGRGLDQRLVASSIHLATGGLLPDLVFLLDLDARVGLLRKHDPMALATGLDGDRFEGETLSFHERVRQGYWDQADADRGRWVVLDATLSPQKIARLIWQSVAAKLQAGHGSEPPHIPSGIIQKSVKNLGGKGNVPATWLV